MMPGVLSPTPSELAAHLPLALAHLLLTWFMVGLIWFVQLVHYPLLAAVGSDRFLAYEAQHMRRTTWIVAPVMLLEAAAALALTYAFAQTPRWPLAVLNLAILGVIWLSTVLIQAPLHHRLSRGAPAELIGTLVRTNWLRTWAWTARGAIAVMMLPI